MLCSSLPSGKIQHAASLSSIQIEAPRRPAFVSLRLPPDGGRGGGSEGSRLPLPSPHHSSASSPRRRIRIEEAVADGGSGLGTMSALLTIYQNRDLTPSSSGGDSTSPSSTSGYSRYPLLPSCISFYNYPDQDAFSVAQICVSGCHHAPLPDQIW